METVCSVEVEVGAASGVVPSALEFAWESARRNTLLDQAVLKVNCVPLEAKCRECGEFFRPGEIYEPCPACGALNPEIIRGKELRVIAIES